ncbi:MAG: hypothetical protein EZS28_041904, partial [Streblomastix strix]
MKNLIFELLPFDVVNFECFLAETQDKPFRLSKEHSGNNYANIGKTEVGYSGYDNSEYFVLPKGFPVINANDMADKDEIILNIRDCVKVKPSALKTLRQMQNLFEKTIDEIAKQKAKYIKESLQKKTKIDEGLKKYRIKAVNNLKTNKEIDYTKVFSKNSIPRKTKAAEIRFQRMEAAKKKAEKLLKKEKNLKLLKKAGKTGLKIAAVTAAAYGAKKLYDKYKKKKLNEYEI